METFSIEKYLVKNSPKEVAKVLEELGAPPVTSDSDLIKKVMFATEKFGDKAYSKLAEIETPYRSLILTQYEKDNEGKSNCGGCSGADGKKCNGCDGKKSNADGWETPDNVPVQPAQTASWQDTQTAPSNTASISTPHPLMVATAVLAGVLVVVLLVKAK